MIYIPDLDSHDPAFISQAVRVRGTWWYAVVRIYVRVHTRTRANWFAFCGCTICTASDAAVQAAKDETRRQFPFIRAFTRVT